MSTECYGSIPAARWNACLKLLCRPIDSLNASQRPAALVFHYDGRVQNGGHSSHWDSTDTDDDELLRALRVLGAHEQARIFAEARILKSEADEATGGDQDSIWELIGDIDRRYYTVSPEISELLARYFNAHAESFPNESTA